MSELLHEPGGVPKVHPLDREMLPEDPLHLQAFEVPGDTELMFRIGLKGLGDFESTSSNEWERNSMLE